MYKLLVVTVSFLSDKYQLEVDTLPLFQLMRASHDNVLFHFLTLLCWFHLIFIAFPNAVIQSRFLNVEIQAFLFPKSKDILSF